MLLAADKLLQSEKLIIELKYCLPRFSKMGAINTSKYAAALIVRINAAVGWSFPSDDKTKQILIDEFSLYLKERCADMNPDEIAYAVRSKGLTVITWGKNINIALIDQCVCEYRSDRDAVSEVERLSSQTQGVAEKELLPAGPVDWSSIWNECLESAKKGQINKIIISAALYDWLDSVGKVKFNPEAPDLPGITDKQKQEILLHVTGLYVAELENVILNNAPHLESKFEVKKRHVLLTTDNTAWYKYAPLKSTLTNLAKIETVRQLAIATAKKSIT